MTKRLLAIWLGKLILLFTKLFSQGGGTAAPGFYALKIAPNLLEYFTSQILSGSVVITGTNGKTTTARLISQHFSQKNISYIHNRAGSNLERGLVSTCIEHCNIKGKLNHEYGIWELDEAAFTQTIHKIKPSHIILLNLFRDQLDRYGEVDATKNKWLKALHNISFSTTILYNSDDPQLVHLAELLKQKNNSVKFKSFSIKPISENISEKDILSPIELVLCPRCKIKLNIQTTIAGLGIFKCDNCQLQNNAPNTQIVNWKLTALGTKGELFKNNSIPFDTNLSGLFNLYNLLAGASYFININEDIDEYLKLAKQYKPAFARMEQINFRNSKYTLILIKNPTGFTESLKTIFDNNASYKEAIFLLNDNYADGKDVSWIWDVNLSKYLPGNIEKIITGGTRTYDMALRIKYSGVNQSNIVICENLHEIFENNISESIPIFATYTASLQLQDYFEKNGVKTKYWKE